jgi:hypothetical protein
VKTYELICTDCALYINDGTEAEDRATALRVKYAVTDAVGDCGYWYLTGDEEEFSWAACDCCGSKLGGMRHGATLMRSNADSGSDKA